jgi:hypothetical protein
MRRLYLPLVALLAAQAGHLVSYQLKYGAAAAAVQGHGAHAYFPSLVAAAGGVLGAGLLAGLLLIGVARVIRGRGRSRTGPPLIELLAPLFAAQLLFFVCQEMLEVAAAGGAPPELVSLLLWGSCGQLPIAILAAFALKWLWTRAAVAAADLRSYVPRPSLHFRLGPATVAWTEPAPELGNLALARSLLARRGPPVPS